MLWIGQKVNCDKDKNSRRRKEKECESEEDRDNEKWIREILIRAEIQRTIERNHI